MASKNPVPSRAALNALRGVVLTTSCSVILLAEERRRRLKIARAAIDNARKLHTVRSNRGPLALTEGLAQWEGSFSGVGDDVLSVSSIPRPRTSTRRRRRRDGSTDSSPDVANIHDHSTELQISRGAHTPASATSTAGLASLHTFVPDAINLESLKFATPSPTARPRDGGWRPPKAFSNITAYNSISAQSAQVTKPNKAKGSPLDDHPANIEPNPPMKAVDPLDSARSYLIRSVQGSSSSPPRPFYDEALVILDQLLGQSDMSHLDRTEICERIELANRVLQRLASFGLPIPRAAKSIKAIGVELLRLTSRNEPSKTVDVLAALIPLCRDPLRVIISCFEFVQASGSVKHMETLLSFLSDRKRSQLWMRGLLLHRILARHGKLQEDFDSTKQLYRAMRAAGIFKTVAVPYETEYKIRRLMILMAAEARNDSFLSQELQAIRNLAPDAHAVDLRLQGKLSIRDAELGNWSLVHEQLRRLDSGLDTTCADFQAALIRITDVFAQTHTPNELEAFVRALATTYQMKPKNRWVYRVLDEHASRRQTDAVFQWLRFCRESGLPMDDAFVERLYTRCRKYWSFSDTSIASLQQSLRACGSRLQLVGEQRDDAAACGQDSRSTRDVNSHDKSASSSGLRGAVMEHLNAKNGAHVDEAIALIRSAHERGQDISNALTPVLMARLERGDDPTELIEEALRMGARIHDSAFNKASQLLSAKGNLRGAAEICKVAARENGNGQLLYNEYNFANLVFAYTGSARYGDLKSILCDFTSGEQWWHGSRTCKESVKLAMKTAAMRAVVQPKDMKPHRQALDQLDAALIHVKQCRSNRGHRRAVTEAIVRVIKNPSDSKLYENMGLKRGHVQGHAGGQLLERSAEPLEDAVLTAAAGAG
ncbi:hypothetical protein JDV02_000202 [Purpureocillium takamizusanense]|uniref:Pentatricopeptide repeat protein n=1 Tax=Purpureocillium takamizusanense TaxID=2060973 RepID=A0A9Q8V654_9HYPO|nr:uncharacterized protein JDV02_000202 [Purpureocillium takamizusanense]UNI13457.1 hypothetical protein JDV02_000202 [Purpureocillium takamizusanense]